MDIAHLFAHDEILPSYFENLLGHAVAVLSSNFAVTRLDATHLRVPASAGVGAAVISIQGRPRWVEANVDRAHPGGAAGAYDVFVTASDQSISNVPVAYTDNTNYAFALTILPAGATPPTVAGTVDIYRRVASCQWDGAQITQLDPVVNSAPAGWPSAGPAGQASLRMLGSGPTDAAAGSDSRIPTQGENDALQGTSGAPGNGNRFVTDQDPRLVPNLAQLPQIGHVSDYAGASDPNAYWMVCDGRALSRSTYAELFAVVGTTFGAGDGSTTFNIPDARGRATVGAGTGAGLSARARGAKMGEETHALTTPEMPSHTHTATDAGHAHGTTDPGHSHRVGSGSGFLTDAGGWQYLFTSGGPGAGVIFIGRFGDTADRFTGLTVNTDRANVTNASTGGGGSHNNMQPSLVLNKVIRVL